MIKLMNSKLLVFILCSHSLGANIMQHSRIKGTMMGAALADAFARVIKTRKNHSSVLLAFDDFEEGEWVVDSAGYDIGIGSEYSVITSALLECFIRQRRINGGKNEIIDEYRRTLHQLLGRIKSDPFYKKRKFKKETLRCLKALDPRKEINPESKECLTATGTFPLVCMVPLGMAFCDDLAVVKVLADECIQLTHAHPSVRATGVSLAVAIACIMRNYSSDRVISQMVRVAEDYRELESEYKKSGPIELGQKKPHDYYTADLIKYFATDGQKKKLEELIGSRREEQKEKRDPLLSGNHAENILSAVVYMYVRNCKNFQQLLTEVTYCTENTQLVSYLSGALMGGNVGFSGLRKQNFADDLEMLEKINVLQSLCNDLYLVLQDYKPYSLADLETSKKIATSGKPLFRENSSDDFIIRWGFQDMCDHVFDPRTIKWAHPTSTKEGGVRFNHADVRPGDVIFVRDIELFMKEMHPAITVPYIMLTHGEFRDTCLEHHLNYLDDDKIIAWFSIHPPKNFHPKFYPLPLGILQKGNHYNKVKRTNNFLKALRKTPKRKLLYMNMSLEQKPSRQECHKLLADKPFCFEQKTHLAFEDYLSEMSEFKFVLSPRGFGPDCYRTWEALLVGTVPIVKRCQFDQLHTRRTNVSDPGCRSTLSGIGTSQLDELYKDLPILVIDDWGQLTEDFLLQKYEEITSKTYDLDRLYLDYWYKKIGQVKQSFIQDYYQEKNISK